MLTPDCRRLNPDPRPLTLEKKVPKQTCKPSSVLQPFDRSNGHSSRAPVTRRFKRPTRERRADHPTYAPLFGLAPSGVYQALDVATETGELLPHRFTLTSKDCQQAPFHEAVYFLWHFPSRRRDWALPSTLSCGARTFLPSGLPPNERPFRLLWQHMLCIVHRYPLSVHRTGYARMSV